MSEASLQANVIKYIQLQYPRAIYCASLGGQYQRYPSQRNKAKATGYVRGFPDLGIYERGLINGVSYNALFIEIKQKGGYPTKEQKDWIIKLNNRGYYAVCLKGLDDIIDTIDKYLINQ
tara:strand:+ start:3045 stop:3401 length:357 start_codon:yes stop_codon:yes gene_type:complete